MADRVVRNLRDLIALVRLFRGLKFPFTVEWRLGQDRTKAQNRLQRLWLNESAEQLGDMTAEEIRAQWKLTVGVPILRRDNAAFRESYDETFRPLPYHTKLKLFMDLDVPVTRKMKVPQMIEYLDTIDRGMAQQGVRLTQPDPELAAYHARYRRKDAT